jgi:hypothetical protein
MLVKREATAVRVAAPTLHVANNKYEGARTRETTRRGESQSAQRALGYLFHPVVRATPAARLL